MAPIPDVADVIDMIPVSQFSELVPYFFVETVVLAVASTLNVSLLVMLQKYSGIHTHLTIIIKYIIGFFCLFCFHGLLRLLNIAYEWQTVFQDQGFILLDCLETIPSYGYTAICFLAMIVAVERGYATQKFQSYEYDNFPAVYSWICRFTLIPIPLFLIDHIWTAEAKGYMICAGEDTTVDRLRRSIYPIITAFFMLTVGATMRYFLKLNHDLQEEYVKNNYSSISCRFQSRENLHTCTFLSHIFVTTAILLLSLAAVELEFVLPRDGSLLDSMKKKETTHLLSQSVLVVFPGFFYYVNKRLCMKLKQMLCVLKKDSPIKHQC